MDYSNKKQAKTCSICKNLYYGMGNNAQPLNNGRCCDECNALVVVPVRIRRMFAGKNPREVSHAERD
jgi:hypothetical protein